MTPSDPPTADDLLGQTAWLRRFAADLVGADLADDVAQETLLRALSFGHEARAWRPWLAQVARSVAWRWRRGEASRRQREQAAARAERQPPTADTVAAFAAHRAVVEAVSTLEEPYRSTLLLRFWEDLPPREVAKRTGVPVETVRTRVRRGCALVRARLDQAQGPPRLARAAPRRAWPARRGRGGDGWRRPCSFCSRARRVGHVEGSVVGRFVRGRAGRRRLVAVDEDSRKHVEGVQTLRQLDGDRRLDREGLFVRAGADGTFESREVPWGDASVLARGDGAQRTQVGGTVVHVAKTGSGAEVVVRLRPGATIQGMARDDRGEPRADLPLVLEWRGTPELGSIEHDRGHEMLDGTTTTARDGTFRFEGVLPGGYQLDTRIGRETIRLASGELAEGMTQRLEVVVPRRAGLTVRVVDAQGQPLEGWAVDAAPKPHGSHRGKHLRTDATGTSRFEGLHDVDQVVCVHAPDAADPLGFARFPVAVETWRREPSELVVRVPSGGGATASLRGRMVDARGLPVRNLIEIALALPDFAEHLNVEADASGAFTAGPLPAGSYVVRSKAERSAGCQFGPFLLAAGETKELGELRLPDPARVRVELELPDAAAANGLQAQLVAADGSRRPLLGGKDGAALTSGSLLAGRWTLRIFGDHVAPHVEAFELAPGESKRLAVRCRAGVVVPLAIDCSLDVEQVRRGEGYAVLDLWDAEGRQLLAEHDVRGRLDGRAALAASLRLLPGTYRAKLRGRSGQAEVDIRVAPAGGDAVRVALR